MNSTRPQFGPPLGQARLSTLDAAAALAAGPRGAGLIHRQTAILFGPAGVGGQGKGFRPIYHELSFNFAALTAQVQAEDAVADPFLERHLAMRLDPAILTVLARLAAAGPRSGDLPVHANLTIPGILSEAFQAFAAGVGQRRLGIEVALAEAGADPDGFAAAREVVGNAGMTLVLDGISGSALRLALPGSLDAGLLKLNWMPDLATDPGGLIADAVERIGAAAVVVQRADSEAALRWGRSLGVRRFQGRHVDAMLAASRIIGCPMAAACTLAQCMERAAATLPAGRLGCGNPALLDAAAAAMPAVVDA